MSNNEKPLENPADNIAVQFSGVSKLYKLYTNDRQKLVAALIPGKKLRQKVANDDISFEIKRGESAAILGKNGAGKSTLLKLITGVTFPSSGEVVVTAKLAQFWN